MDIWVTNGHSWYKLGQYIQAKAGKGDFLSEIIGGIIVHLIWCWHFSMTASLISDQTGQKTFRDATERGTALTYVTVSLIISRVLLNRTLQLTSELCLNLAFDRSKFGSKFQFRSYFFFFLGTPNGSWMWLLPKCTLVCDLHSHILLQDPCLGSARSGAFTSSDFGLVGFPPGLW